MLKRTLSHCTRDPLVNAPPNGGIQEHHRPALAYRCQQRLDHARATIPLSHRPQLFLSFPSLPLLPGRLGSHEHGNPLLSFRTFPIRRPLGGPSLVLRRVFYSGQLYTRHFLEGGLGAALDQVCGVVEGTNRHPLGGPVDCRNGDMVIQYTLGTSWGQDGQAECVEAVENVAVCALLLGHLHRLPRHAPVCAGGQAEPTGGRLFDHFYLLFGHLL